MDTRIQTINVLDVRSKNPFIIQSIESFQATNEGIREAEEAFREIVRENKEDVTDEQVERFVAEGYCDIDHGFVAIIHSMRP